MRAVIRYVAVLALLAAPAVHAQEEPQLTLELNKLEPVPAAQGGTPSCRAYLVAANPDGGARFDALRLDLVLFGTDGVIARRIALDVGPVAPGRTQVRLFDLRDLPCDGIGQVLVNDTMICKVAGADRSDCMDRLKTASRVSAKLVK
ncbi:MAG: Tat pathway signal protein [Acetobacteraceae bacterium]|nr:Tat pathway signal protein [Acetobacteraceae bacterium]